MTVKKTPCYRCKSDSKLVVIKKGHLTRDCPQRDRKADMECHKCDEIGHFGK